MEENKVAVETPEVVEAPAKEETKKAPLNASVAPENFDWDAFEKEAAYGDTDKATTRRLMKAHSQKLMKMK